MAFKPYILNGTASGIGKLVFSVVLDEKTRTFKVVEYGSREGLSDLDIERTQKLLIDRIKRVQPTYKMEN